MTPEQAEQLRAEFPPEAIGKLPRGNTTLDYCGHAAVTDRLLKVDPEWNWEPVAWAIDGTPFWTADGGDAVMWIRLTVAGVTRLGVGICKSNAFELEKQLIGDALRNAAMRFGVALDLWSKEDLSATESAGAAEVTRTADRSSRGTASTAESVRQSGSIPDSAPAPAAPTPRDGAVAGSDSTRPESDPALSPALEDLGSRDVSDWKVPTTQLRNLKAKKKELEAEGVNVAVEAAKRDLKFLNDKLDPFGFKGWVDLIAELLAAREEVAS